MGLTPFPYQREAIDLGTQHNLLCADACGLGKTLTGIEIARGIQAAHPHPVLIVCNKSTKLQWAQAIANQEPSVDINVVHTQAEFTDAHNGRGANDLGWYIIHFAALRKVKVGDPITRTYFSTIVVDEAHRIKNRKAQQTRGVKKLLSYRKIALTATEMERSPEDLWSILNFLEPNKWRGFYAFAAKYVQYEVHPYFGWKKAVGPKNLEDLAKKLRGRYIKRTKEEVREDLPPLREERVPIELNPSLQGAYMEIKTAGDILVPIGDEEHIIPNVLARIMKLRQLTSNGLGQFTSDKLEYVTTYVEDNPDANIVIFSSFRETAQLLARKLKAPLIIGGHTSDLSDKPRLLVGTTAALGESFDLPWMDVAIFVESEWSSTVMAQAKDRIHRINITDPKLALYLYHPGTVDELIFEALDKKWTNLELVQAYLRRET